MAPPRTESVPLRVTSGSPSKRMHTAPEGQTHNVETIAKQFFQMVMRRFEECGVPTDQLSQYQMRFALPSSGTPAAANFDNWWLLAYHPILVDDALLNGMFHLKESTATTTGPAPGTCIYYVRSFRLTAGELLAIIGLLERDRIIVREGKVWAQSVEDLSPDDPVFIRYIGCSMRVSGYERAMSDIVSKDSSSRFFSLFLTKFSEVVGPPLIDGKINPLIRVYEFVDGTAEVLSRPMIRGETISEALLEIMPSREDVDAREQFLIQAFGLPSLLNRDFGGRQVVYYQDEQMKAHFRRLETRLFEKLSHQDKINAPSAELRSDIDNWMKKIQDFAQKQALGTIDDAHARKWAAQAYSATYCGYHLFNLLGEVPSKEALEGPAATIWNQQAQSIDMLAEMFRLLRVLETGDPKSQVKPLFEGSLFPWIDSRYWWTDRKDLNTGLAEMLREYEARIKPLVILSFGSAGCIPANNFAPPPNRFFWETFKTLKQAGKLSLNHWSSDPKAPKDDHYFVSISLPHPGYARYVDPSRVQTLLRIMDMCLWKFVLLVDVFCNLIDSKQYVNRKELCTAACMETTRRWDGAGLDKVLGNIQAEFEKSSRRRQQNDGVFLPTVSGTALGLTTKGSVKDAVVAKINWMKPSTGGQDPRCEFVSFLLPRHICPEGAKDSRRNARIIQLLPQGIVITLKGDTLRLDVPSEVGNETKPWRGKYTSEASITISPKMLQQMCNDKVWGYESLRELWRHESALPSAAPALPAGSSLPPPGGNPRRSIGQPPPIVPKLRPEMSGKEPSPQAKKQQLSLDTLVIQDDSRAQSSAAAPRRSKYACRTCKGNGNRCGKELPKCHACLQRGKLCKYSLDPGPPCKRCSEKGYECDRGFPCNMCPGKKGVDTCRYTDRGYAPRPGREQDDDPPPVVADLRDLRGQSRGPASIQGDYYESPGFQFPITASFESIGTFSPPKFSGGQLRGYEPPALLHPRQTASLYQAPTGPQQRAYEPPALRRPQQTISPYQAPVGSQQRAYQPPALLHPRQTASLYQAPTNSPQIEFQYPVTANFESIGTFSPPKYSGGQLRGYVPSAAPRPQQTASLYEAATGMRQGGLHQSTTASSYGGNFQPPPLRQRDIREMMPAYTVPELHIQNRLPTGREVDEWLHTRPDTVSVARLYNWLDSFLRQNTGQNTREAALILDTLKTAAEPDRYRGG